MTALVTGGGGFLGRAIVEASGGITYDTVRAVAETGVDLISIGGLTHSVDALDINLDLEFDQSFDLLVGGAHGEPS